MVSHRVERKTRVTGDEAPPFARQFSSRERETCGARVEIELKMAGNKNKNVNWGLTCLFTAFQQNHHNHQLELVVMPNEMVALITVITH